MEHYEELWEESENVAAECYEGVESNKIFERLEGKLLQLKEFKCDGEELSRENIFELFGDIIFYICYLSKKHNVNTFWALHKAMTNHKIDIMDD